MTLGSPLASTREFILHSVGISLDTSSRRDTISVVATSRMPTQKAAAAPLHPLRQAFSGGRALLVCALAILIPQTVWARDDDDDDFSDSGSEPCLIGVEAEGSQYELYDRYDCRWVRPVLQCLQRLGSLFTTSSDPLAGRGGENYWCSEDDEEAIYRSSLGQVSRTICRLGTEVNIAAENALLDCAAEADEEMEAADFGATVGLVIAICAVGCFCLFGLTAACTSSSSSRSKANPQPSPLAPSRRRRQSSRMGQGSIPMARLEAARARRAEITSGEEPVTGLYA